MDSIKGNTIPGQSTLLKWESTWDLIFVGTKSSGESIRVKMVGIALYYIWWIGYQSIGIIYSKSGACCVRYLLKIWTRDVGWTVYELFFLKK